ncbi:MAG: hypothetical protein M3417_05370 [Actinomycetota bacterium]|nr:hypothetical protein [Actinomycetota bacterium]
MDGIGLGFITHFQLERLLGGGRAAQQQRRRLTGRGLLPDPTWLRVDRTRLAVFPEFSLSALLGPSNGRAEAVLHIAQRGQALYSGKAFAELRGSLEQAMHSTAPALQQSVELGAFLVREAGAVLEGWRAAVREIADELAVAGHLRMDVETVRVNEIRDGGYLVEGEHGVGDEVVVPLAAAADELSVGSWASLDRVGLLDAQRIFLLGLPEQLVVDENHDLLSALAALMADGPARVPAADIDDGDHEGELPLLPGRRRRTGWHHGNTMTRVGAGR